MDARTTRRISQRDSRYCCCIKAASLNEKPGRGATITACADPPAQASLRTLFAAKSKTRSGSRPLRLRSFTRDQLLHPAIFTRGNLSAEE
jgi:hypothetical protein